MNPARALSSSVQSSRLEVVCVDCVQAEAVVPGSSVIVSRLDSVLMDPG